MIAPGSSRYSSNDMVHNHYLEEAKKKTQESSRNSEPSVMLLLDHKAQQCSKPKPQDQLTKAKNWTASKSSLRYAIKDYAHRQNSLGILEVFLTLKILVWLECQKCVFMQS
ncbi:hypothetical protein Tco_1524543 [Tanacetum coccineum]